MLNISKSMIGLDIIQETMENVKVICEQLLSPQSRQETRANNKIIELDSKKMIMYL